MAPHPRGSMRTALFITAECVRTSVNFYEESAVKSKLRFIFFLLLCAHPERRPPNTAFCICALPLVARVRPPKRTVILGQDSPPFADSGWLCLLRETTNCRASRLAASRVGPALALAQALRAMPAQDFYTCRRTSLPPSDSRPQHHNRSSPT